MIKAAHRDNYIVGDIHLYRYRTNRLQIVERSLCHNCLADVESKANLLTQLRAIRLNSASHCDNCGGVSHDHYNKYLSG